MENARKITFSLPVDLLRSASVLAAQRGMSLNSFVNAALEEKVNRLTEEYRKAGERLLAISRTPLYTMPERPWDRSELHRSKG